MNAPFEPTRQDGRSDRQVIYDLAHGHDPGRLFTYDQLLDALAEGLDERPDRPRAYRAVAQANRLLLELDKRYLQVQRGHGYRVITAAEHLGAALAKRVTAENAIEKGLDILRGTRIEELPADIQKIHQGHMLIMAGLHGAIRESQQRHDRQETLINQLAAKVKTLEQVTGVDLPELETQVEATG